MLKGSVTTAGYNYRGDFRTLRSAVERAIGQMRLKTNSEKRGPTAFQFEVVEKTKLLSTSWPVKLTIDAVDLKGTAQLMVRATSAGPLPAFTQEFSNQNKVKEFLDLVRLFAPSAAEGSSSVSDIERIPCPRCGEMIAKTAKICRFCRTEF